MAAELFGEAFVSAFLQVLFDRLAPLTVVDIFKGKKFKSELLQNLKITMKSVKILLDDAEQKQITDFAVRTWLDDLKDAFYEADDLLDEIAYAALSSEKEAGPQNSADRCWKFNSSHGQLVEIESKLVEIHGKLQKFFDQKDVLGLREGTGERCTGERLSSQKVQTGHLMDACFYGREEDERVILQLLLSDDANSDNLGIIPIVGMGGIGKTTLAQRVYNDSSVKKRFGPRAWISVSSEVDVSKVTWQILNGFDITSRDIDNLDYLQDQLQEKLTGQKFLLVLDDVWKDKFDHWDTLLRPLRAGAKGSKTIITTRNNTVASVLQVQTHHLKKLSDEECWRVFTKYASDGGSSGAYTDLEREIVEKCDGLPLVAKSLGVLLRPYKENERREIVLHNKIWNLRNDNIIPALRLSYLSLSSPLKQCFAYCGLFPKEYCFTKEKLVLLWMGEGFLGQASIDRSNMKREVTGKEYFDELVSKSFLIPMGVGFIMHGVMNHLARVVAGEFCFTLNDDDEYKISPKTRHLCYARKKLPSNNSEGITASPLRTFLFNTWFHNDEEVIYDIVPKLKHLRVLSFCGYFGGLKLDDSVNNLKYLRYLDLSRKTIEVLPEFLCNLYYLEILLLVGCSELKELSPDLGNLANLCVLNIEGTIKLQKMPLGMSKLTKLQMLSHFVIGKKSGSSIQELKNLRKLEGRLVITNLENVTDVEALSPILKDKMLKELELDWKGDVDDLECAGVLLEKLEPHEGVETLRIRRYGGTEFPDWIGGGSPLRLVTLDLFGCIHCCKLPSLGQLANLKDLTIRDFPKIESIGSEFFYGRCTSFVPFQSLEALRFKNMPKWCRWDMCGNEVFRHLQELCIIRCPAFKQSLPRRHFPSLNKPKITGERDLWISMV